VPNEHKCGGDGGCKGATVELAYDYTMKNGLQEEADVPYLAKDHACMVGQIGAHADTTATTTTAASCPGSDLPPCATLRAKGLYLTFMPEGGRTYNTILGNERIEIKKLSGNTTKPDQEGCKGKVCSFDGKYGLWVNGKYVAAENDKTKIKANRDTQDTWEAFTIDWNVPTSTISIKTFHNTFFKLTEQPDDKLKKDHPYLVTQADTLDDDGKFEVIAIKCDYEEAAKTPVKAKK